MALTGLLRGREKIESALQALIDHRSALHLRAMNMLYEGLKEKALSSRWDWVGCWVQQHFVSSR
jgi:hypothetical protein